MGAAFAVAFCFGGDGLGTVEDRVEFPEDAGAGLVDQVGVGQRLVAGGLGDPEAVAAVLADDVAAVGDHGSMAPCMAPR